MIEGVRQVINVNKPHLSISQLDLMSGCGERYRRRYIDKDRPPLGTALVVGKAVDNSVTHNLDYKMRTGELLTAEEAVDIAAKSVIFEWENVEIALNKKEREKGPEQVKGDLIDKAVRLARLHYAEIAPFINPTALQRKVEIEFKYLPYNLVGVIDVQEADTVRDTKTSGKSPVVDAADTSDQLTVYALAVWVLDGRIPARLTLDYLVDTKTPKTVIRETVRNEADFHPLMARIESAIKAIENEVFVPCKQGSYPCTSGGCEYYDTCKFVRQMNFFIPGNGDD